LIEAYKILLNKIEFEIQLVIAGKSYKKYNDPEKIILINQLENRIKILDYVNEHDLRSLYQHAALFVLPSLYEGFGLPILEALDFGIPVVAAKSTSLPEVTGDSGLLCDPNNSNDIANKIFLVLTNKSVRENLRKKSTKHLNNFSWRKAALKTLSVYEDVYSKIN
jgi:glycosyltransferase involved in cell wall biosynthesis